MHRAASPEKHPRTHDGAGLGAKFRLSSVVPCPAPDSQAPTPQAREPKERALPRFTSPNPLHCVQTMKNSDTGGRSEAGLEAQGLARTSQSPTPVGCGTGMIEVVGKLRV